MNRLDIYIAKSVLTGIVAALFIIVAIDWLGDLFYQVGRMSANDLFLRVVLVTLLDIPHKLLEFLPSALLIGTLLSLGQLASTSEIIASSASGCSRLRIALVACIMGLLLTVSVALIEEFYSPLSDKFAARFQQGEQAENVLLASDDSYWMRDQNRFIRIGSIISPDYLRNLTIYNFGDDGEVVWIGQADAAIHKQNEWSLMNFRRSSFSEQQVTTEQSAEYHWRELFLTNYLQSMSADPFKLPLRRLAEYISYLDENRLDATAYRVALYKKMAVPFTGIAMLLLALPLVFRPRQLGGIGQRLFLGIIVALLAYVIIEAITNGAVVYQFSPVLAAFSPMIIITGISILAFRIIR